MKVVLLGGGGFRTPLTVSALRRAAPRLDVNEVALYDVDASRLRTMFGIVEAMKLTDSDARMTVSATTDLPAALRGADFVLCAIRVGGLSGRAVDERLAIDAGLVGQETVGAAGLCLLMRSVPIMSAIAEHVARLAPGAWFINFSNPVGGISGLLRETLGDRVLGVCDTPAALFRRVAALLDRDVDDLRFDYFGLNHLGWLRSVLDEQRDLLPELLSDDTLLARLEEGRLFGAACLRDLHMLPVEYLSYYYFPERHLAAVAEAGYSRAEYLLRQQERLYAAVEDAPARSLELWRAARSERERSYLTDAGMSESERAADDGYAGVAMTLMESLRSNVASRAVVDVENRGVLPFLPPEATVEVPCAIDTRGAMPCAVETPPRHASVLMQQVYAAEQAAIHAVRSRSRAEAAAALTAHPLVASTSGERLFDAYLEHQPDLAAQFA